MPDSTICYSISTGDLHGETVTAFLAELPFTGFEAEASSVHAYMPRALDDATVAATIEQLCERFNMTFTKREIPDTNWNARWEADYPEVIVGDWLRIRAPFHEPNTAVQHEVVIHPEMSFGTGHHETTYMMAALMREHSPFGKTCFDFGTGTGVLAILAAKLGAVDVIATDIDERCVRSTHENAVRNGVTLQRVGLGTQANLPDKSFDLILANINRGVLVEAMPALAQRLNADAQLWMSGILAADFELIKNRMASSNLSLLERQQRGDWLALRTTRTS